MEINIHVENPKKSMLQWGSEKRRGRTCKKKDPAAFNSSNVSDDDMDYNYICDEDALDDINLSYVPSDEKSEAKFTCAISEQQEKAEL